jgi:AcrR family transcriptional regulator
MNTSDTKTALLQAAKRLVLERGYAGASVRELAAASGTNLGAVNYHFGSRENLLNQAILEFFLEWSERVGGADVDPAATPLEELAARALPMVAGIAEAQPLFVMFLEGVLQSRHAPELKEQLAAHYAEQRSRAGERIAASPAGAALSERMLEVAASYMIAVADGMQLQALLEPAAIPTGEELAAFYEGLAAAARAGAPPGLQV